MKLVLKLISYAALVAIILQPILYITDKTNKESLSLVMLIGTLVWFATVPFWMGRDKEA